MTKLLIALANAHKALLETTQKGGATPAGTAALRKLEPALIEALQGCEKITPDVRIAVLHAGSRKAMELLPEMEGPVKGNFGFANGPQGLDSSFLLQQPPAYVKAARKRGFAIDGSDRIKLLDKLASETTDTAALDPTLVKMLAQGPVDAVTAHRALQTLIDAPTAGQARIAPLVAALWKEAAKTNAVQMSYAVNGLVVVHDPALASPYVFKALVAHALAGTKKPEAERCVHPKVHAAVEAMYTTAGRSALRAAVGDLATWLAQGAPAPRAILSLEQARTSYRPPMSRGFFR